RSPQGPSPGVVTTRAQDSAGIVWAGGRFGLRRLVNNRWQAADKGLPPGLVNEILIVEDAVIVATATGVFRRGSNDDAFTPLGHFHDSTRSVVRDISGRLWFADPISGARSIADEEGI